jgi:hypothetical protein
VADLVLKNRPARIGDVIEWNGRLWVCAKCGPVYSSWRLKDG